MFALPGSCCVYQGEELGLPEVEDLPDAPLQDPTWFRSNGTDRGREAAARADPVDGRSVDQLRLPRTPSLPPLPPLRGCRNRRGSRRTPPMSSVAAGSMLELYRSCLAPTPTRRW
ncbi:MAG: hypothetical protein R2713_03630 [Ilumatobacteraceae bacterium]